MPDNKKIGTPEPPPSSSSTIGLKFNNVGREEPAREIIAAKMDPAARRRAFLISGMVAIAFIALIITIFMREGNPFAPPAEPAREFRPPPDRGSF